MPFEEVWLTNAPPGSALWDNLILPLVVDPGLGLIAEGAATDVADRAAVQRGRRRTQLGGADAATIGVALALMIGALVTIQRRVIGAGEAA